MSVCPHTSTAQVCVRLRAAPLAPDACHRRLWTLVKDVPPLDYTDPSLLDTDPDLVLQEGPDALPVSV